MARLICLASLLCVIAVDIVRCQLPRGVGKANASLYKPNTPFKCLDGSNTIPFEWVNDDYCDCKDGSDEPGTSACSNGKFYCVNRGYKPEVIASSRVSDGICDCCDGTDEYNGDVQCQDNCMELGKSMREELEAMRALVMEGHRIRTEYSEQGRKAKDEQQALLVSLGPQRDELLKKKEELQAIKDDAEEPERDAKQKHEDAWNVVKEERAAAKKQQQCETAFKLLDIDQDGSLISDELMAQPDLDHNNDGVVNEEDISAIMGDTELPSPLDLETFCSTVYPLLQSYLPSTGKAPPLDAPPTEDAQPPPPEEDDDDEDFEEDDFDDDDEEATPQEHTDTDESMPTFPPETLELIRIATEAREAYNKAEEEYKELDSQINNIEALLSSDLGPEDVFYPLKDQCFEFTDREYTYKFCPFDKTSQRPKAGGSETSLGHFTEFITKDSEKYAGMKFEKGLHCWNGPDRSANVYFSCGRENVLQSASEPNRCEYAFEFSTPAACSQHPEDLEEITTPRHIEL